MIKYTSYKNLRNLLWQMLSSKISYKIQLKNFKYLPPQSLACEVDRKQENEENDLLPQSRRTRKINDKTQQRVVKYYFCAKSTTKCIKTKYNISCSQSRVKSQIKRNIRKASKISYSPYPVYSYFGSAKRKISVK